MGMTLPLVVSLIFCSLLIVKKTIILYGLALAALVFVMKLVEYRFMVRDQRLEFYVGIVAVMFVALGVWIGLKLTRKKVFVAAPDFRLNEGELKRLGISKREHEVLELMAQGFSNQEIADKLFVSSNTIKTHSSNIFSKLEVTRRTQAIKKARELSLIA